MPVQTPGLSTTTAPIENEPSGFNIANFKAKIESRGILKNNKFQVRFNAPGEFKAANPGLMSAFNSVDKDMVFWADGAAIPGISLSLRPLLHYGYGATEKKPVAPVFNDIRMSIINDGTNDNWNFFQQWVNFIVKFDFRNNFSDKDNQNTIWEVRYKSSYATNIQIVEYDDSGKPVMNIILQDAFPFAVQDIPLNWADNTNVQRVPVEFTFRDYYNQNLADVT